MRAAMVSKVSMISTGRLVESGLKNQETGQVHQNIQWIRHRAGPGHRQDPFEKDSEQDHGQESVESRQRETVRPKGQPQKQQMVRIG